MKFEITMKDPDGFYESVQDAVQDSMSGLKISPREEDGIFEMRVDELKEKLNKWFEYNEYVTLVVDTDAMTCVVKESGN